MKAVVPSAQVLLSRSSSEDERLRNEKIDYGFQASSSIGRAAVSKTAGWGFDSLLACQIGVQEEVLDKLKLAAAALIVVAAVAVFYVFGGSSALLRTGIVIVSVIVGAGVALTSEPGRNAWQFAVGTRAEVRQGRLAESSRNDPVDDGCNCTGDTDWFVPVVIGYVVALDGL